MAGTGLAKKAVVIESNAWECLDTRPDPMLACLLLIVLNPVRAKMVTNPNRYPWSSYPATVGAVAPPAHLGTD